MSEVKTRITADNSQFMSSVEKAQAKIRNFSTGELSALKGQLAAAFTVGAITALAKEAVDFGGKIDDLSKATGVGAEALQKLDYAAKQNGSSIDEVAGGLSKLSKSMKDALGGNQEALKSFEALGVSLEDLKTKSADQIFLQLADAVKNSSDPTATMGELMNVLGRGAGQLIPLLMEGSDGLKALGDEAARTGNVLADNTIKRLDELGDRLERNKGLLRQAGAEVALFASNLATKTVQGVKAAAATVALLPELLAADADRKGKLLDIIAEESGIKADVVSQSGLANVKSRAGDFSREATDSGASRKADRIKRLQEQIAEEQFKQGLQELQIEEQITALQEKQLALKRQQSDTSDEEERLKIEKDILDINKELSELSKKQESENLKQVQEFGKEVADRASLLDSMDRIREGKGISVDTPITDSLARIGGFVGGAGDNQIRLMERQIRVQEQIRDAVLDFNRKNNPYGVEDDFRPGI